MKAMAPVINAGKKSGVSLILHDVYMMFEKFKETKSPIHSHSPNSTVPPAGRFTADLLHPLSAVHCGRCGLRQKYFARHSLCPLEDFRQTR